MKPSNISRLARIILSVFVTSAFALAIPTASDAAPTNKREIGCQAKLGKGLGKLWKVEAKVNSKCRDTEIKKPPLSCPDAKGQAKVDKLAAKLGAIAAGSCGGTCDPSSTVTCLRDSQCPPDGSSGELCSGFDLSNLGFDGALCPALIGSQITGPDSLGLCLSNGAAANAGYFMSAVYGETTSASGLSATAGKCLASASKAVQKAASTIYKSITKCVDAVNNQKIALSDSSLCATDDPATAAAIADALTKLNDAVNAKCTDADVLQLDLCEAGTGGTATAADAGDCLQEVAVELANTSLNPAERSYSSLTLTELLIPPAAGTCGDNLLNQLPEPFLPIGEECDGTSDAACPGECLPPGDIFECTCANVPRLWNQGKGGPDIDIGWTGIAQNKDTVAGSGYMTEVGNDCDCDSMTGPECTGTSVDSVCSVSGRQHPVCSWDVTNPLRCDEVGNGNTVEENGDCAICDVSSSNSGTFCSTDSDCQAQCFDAAGTATGACTTQADCGAGEACRGRCDKTPTCVRLQHGPPTPTVSLGSPSCIWSIFRDDIVGTYDMVTGAHSQYLYRTALSYTGEALARPCPVCGGVCVGGSAAVEGRPCEGTCSISSDRCRLDSDCPGGETCTTAAAECGSGTCDLELRCVGGDDDGEPCRLHGAPGPYGTPSTDCRPQSSLNFSGAGTVSDFAPSTSAAVTLPQDAYACSANGFSLFGCPCEPVGGAATKPNNCLFACNAGAEEGDRCVTLTQCSGGDNDGLNCDEDADCVNGGTCSANPLQCLGDPAFPNTACTTNADCGIGTCGDPCPSGICTPLCLPTAADPENGECAAGPFFNNCTGDVFRVCSGAAAVGGCTATCSVSATACFGNGDCPAGETCEGDCEKARGCEAGVDGILGNSDDWPEAGVCESAPSPCLLPDMPMEGGDTINGKGGVVDRVSVSVYCIPANTSAAANFGAGLPGGGSLRSRSTNSSNGFPSLPWP